MVLTIDRVELHDFLSHEKTIVTFEPGVTAIVGDNGAGKTSIIDAIIAAFTKITKDLRGGKDGLIRHGRSRAMVTVDFTVDNVKYRVERIITKAGFDEHLLYRIENGKRRLIARGVRNVLKELAKIIGIDMDTLKRIMVFRQGMIQDLIDLFMSGRDEKQRLIDKLLGLNKYEKASEELNKVLKIRLAMPDGTVLTFKPTSDDVVNLRMYIESARRKIHEIEDEIRRNEEAIKSEGERKNEILNKIELLRKEIEATRRRRDEIIPILDEYKKLCEERSTIIRRINEIRNALETLESEREQIRANMEKLERLTNAYNMLIKLSQRLNELSRLEIEHDKLLRIIKLYDEVKRLEAMGVLRKYERLNQLDKEIASLRSIIAEKSRELSEVEARLRSIESEVKVLEDEFNRLKSSLNIPIEEIDNKIKKLIAEKSKLEALRDELRNKINSLRVVRGGVCPLCKRPLSLHHRLKLIAEYNKELRSVEEKIKSIEREQNEYNALMEKAKSIIDKLNELQTALRSRMDSRRELIERANNIQAELRDLNNRLSMLTSEYDKLVREGISDTYKRYLGILNELKGYREIDYDNVKNELKDLKKKIDHIRDEIHKLALDVSKILNMLPEQVINSIESLLRSLEPTVRGYEDSRRKLMEVESRINELSGELKAYEDRLSEINNRISGIDYEGLLNEYRGVEETLNSLEKEYEDLHKELMEVDGKIRAYKEINMRLERELERYRRFLDEALKHLGVLELACYLRENVFHTEKLPAEIRNTALKMIEEEASRILQEFELDYTNIYIDKEINILVASSNMTRRLNELSGGEQVAVVLAIIMALHKVIGRGRLGSLILDEPTIHLDAERRKKLIEIIKRFKGGTLIPQFIVITHHREVEDAADHLYEVVKTVGGVSKVKQVT